MAADIIIVNGSVITFDPHTPRASALAIGGGRILAVGETATIKELATPATKIIDAAQASVLPGFIDSHVHLFQGSVEIDYLNLFGVQGIEELTAKLRPYAAQNPDDRVVFAVMADYFITGPGQHTTRQALDMVLPDRPLALFASDHHTLWANTAALEMAGILHGGPVDMGAEIVMAADGTATGELREPGAYAPVLALTRYGGRDMMGLVTGENPTPPATLAERRMDRDVIARGLRHCASHGITGLHNMDGNFYQMELLDELQQNDALICRTEVPFHYKSYNTLDRFDEAREMQARFQSDFLWCNRVKMFMDGVIESGTALMTEPYPNSTHHGDAVFEPEHFNQACIRADAMGLQISTHAIGDLAIRRTLNGYAAAREANGARDSRHRIEHLELIHPDDLPRLKDLGVVASIQPAHAPFGTYFHGAEGGIRRMLHEHQIARICAWQDIRATGTPVIFSTDWPVVPVDVMPNVVSAVAPRFASGGWKNQSQSLMDTLHSYTAGNAWAEFNEHRKGRLMAGMMADIVVMQDNLEAMAPETLDQTRARVTICGGRVTYDALL